MKKLFYFFPIQLLIYHIKKNFLFIVFWVIIFGFIVESFAVKYGIPLLFLSPEYLDHVNFTSFFLMGISVGIFIMAFHITSYIIMGFRFRFIATLSNSFFKFCLNNSLIPLLFLVTYAIKIFTFSLDYAHLNFLRSIGYALSLLFGSFIFILFSSFYLSKTNKKLLKIFGISIEQEQLIKDAIKKPLKKLFSPTYPNEKGIKKLHLKSSKVDSYLYNPFNIKIARKSTHYSHDVLVNILNKHHHNATFFLIAIFTIITILGVFRDNNYFIIPAAASIMLLFSMLLMIMSAVYSWFRSWSFPFFIILLITINYASTFTTLNSRSHAYGLNYENDRVAYNDQSLQSIINVAYEKQDKVHMIEILEQWKEKNTIKEKKPKMVFINSSGGGMRASLFSFHVLNTLNEQTNGELMRKCHMISGSSGGLLGTAYFRELLLQNIKVNKAHYKNISKDMINPIAFTILVNDLLFRLQQFNDGKYIHTKDRGFAFENALHRNTDSILSKNLKDYKEVEKQSIIPLMVFSPINVNDGRRLIISAQPVSYLSHNTGKENFDDIEFGRLFKDQGAENLHFTSAIRMDATFPYISPTVYLPSKPMMEMMDSGIRDYLGTDITTKFIYTFREWIAANTSGVVILQIRDRERLKTKEKQIHKSILDAATAPIEDINRFWSNMRDLDRDKQLIYMKEWLDVPLDVVTIQLTNDKHKKVALSWHLIEKEKNHILHSIKSNYNQIEIEKFKVLID